MPTENKPTFQAVSRGFLNHLSTLNGNQVKFFIYCLLKAKNLGEGKGSFQEFATDIAEDLGWLRKDVYKNLKMMSKYLDVKYSKNRHKPLSITVKKFKCTEYFYRNHIGNGKGDSKGYGKGDSKGDSKLCNSAETNALQNPNKENKVIRENKENKKVANATIFPASLNTKTFLKAWNEWRTHRAQIKKKLTPLQESKQLAALEKVGESAAVAAIENSIANGYQGIFPAKTSTKGAVNYERFRENQPDLNKKYGGI